MDARAVHSKTVPVLHVKTHPKTECINHRPLRYTHSLCSEGAVHSQECSTMGLRGMLEIQEKKTKHPATCCFGQEETVCVSAHVAMRGENHLFNSFADQDELINLQASETQN